MGLCWPGLRLCCPNVREETPQDEQKHKRKQKHHKKSRNPMLRRVRPRFAPGSPQVGPRLTRFRGGGSAAGGASLYNLRLLPKASGKGTGEAVGAGARIILPCRRPFKRVLLPLGREARGLARPREASRGLASGLRMADIESVYVSFRG